MADEHANARACAYAHGRTHVELTIYEARTRLCRLLGGGVTDALGKYGVVVVLTLICGDAKYGGDE